MNWCIDLTEGDGASEQAPEHFLGLSTTHCTDHRLTMKSVDSNEGDNEMSSEWERRNRNIIRLG